MQKIQRRIFLMTKTMNINPEKRTELKRTTQTETKQVQLGPAMWKSAKKVLKICSWKSQEVKAMVMQTLKQLKKQDQQQDLQEFNIIKHEHIIYRK